jgi:hypothetical protein
MKKNKKKIAISVSKLWDVYLKKCEFKPKSRFCITNIGYKSIF